MSYVTINLFLLLGFYSLIEPHWIQEKNNTFYDYDIPVEFDSFKVVFISDIHHGPFFNEYRVFKLVKQVNKLEPDILILGGDYVLLSPKYISSFFKYAKDLNAEYWAITIIGKVKQLPVNISILAIL